MNAPNNNIIGFAGALGLTPAEAAVGLALIIAIYRHYKTVNLDEVKGLKG